MGSLTFSSGSVPFVSSGMGVQFTTFEGIIPGILGDLNQLNPLGILKGFMEGNNPKCQNVTLPVTGQDGVTTNEMRHVPVSEIESKVFPENSVLFEESQRNPF